MFGEVVKVRKTRDNVTSHNCHLFVYGHLVFNTYDIRPSGSMAHRKVYEELVMLMNYNPPPVHIAAGSDVAFGYPSMFYDRHLDARLSLNHVKIASSLQSDIAGQVYDELVVLKAKNQPLPPATSDSQDGCCFSTKESRENETLQTTMMDARPIAGFYNQVSYFNCASIASTIALHPHADTWLSILTCYGSDRERESDEYPLMIDEYNLRIRHDHRTGEVKVYDSIWSCLNEELRNDIRGVSSRFGSLAAFQFLAPLPEVEDMFKNMGAMARRKGIPSLACPVFGFVTQNNIRLPPIPDSVLTLKLIPSVAKFCAVAPELRRSVRLNSPKERSPRKKPSKSRGMTKPWPTVTVKQPAARYDSVTFVQHVRDKIRIETS